MQQTASLTRHVRAFHGSAAVDKFVFCQVPRASLSHSARVIQGPVPRVSRQKAPRAEVNRVCRVCFVNFVWQSLSSDEDGLQDDCFGSWGGGMGFRAVWHEVEKPP